MTTQPPAGAARHQKGPPDMAFSEQMATLSTRAKLAEAQAAAAGDKAKAELESDVSAARDAALEQADELRDSADAAQGRVSDRWADLQKSWSEHVAAARKAIDDKQAQHDLGRARRHAEVAEDDALYAIAYAYSAIEEAEYCVLNAQLAQLTADELAAGAHASA
jgi:hypothetical protein